MKKIVSLCFVLLLFSFSTFFILHETKKETLNDPEFNICENGIVFTKLNITPEFYSQSQKDFYISQYKYQAQRCN